jgi:methylase of polypeptide subunit release factors
MSNIRYTNEWEFTSEVSSWVNGILEKNPSWVLDSCRAERTEDTSEKRRDLTLFGEDGEILVTGEVKLPYQNLGASPYNARVVRDARAKAESAGADYFFTWNVNQCVLWETETASVTFQDSSYKSWYVTDVQRPTNFSNPRVIEDIQEWIPALLRDISQAVAGNLVLGQRPPDEKFIEALESSLELPIKLNFEEVLEKYEEDGRFRESVNSWLREEQGRTISDDPKDIRENLEDASRYACFTLVNRLVFYDALLKRYDTQLERLDVPHNVDNGESLRLHLAGYFEDARQVTGDYETVFGETHQSVENRIPFLSDAAVQPWRELIDQTNQFDLSQIDYDVIGDIFEKLIGPEERHKYGQYYTSSDVVDLINSFCVKDGSEKVLDPACGAGTFLVRSYARKRELKPNKDHEELISEIYGVDISNFASHLSTINLATRDLVDRQNYPNVARSDFFDVEVDSPINSLPSGGSSDDSSNDRSVRIPEVDCVVGNPPYVRQEDIKRAESSSDPEPGTKEYYSNIVEEDAEADLSGRSDLHVYFWPHAYSFLKDDGYLCLLTSSQWLGVKYGFKLQDWILQNFEIKAVLESIHEPWFVGARVVTAVTVLKRQSNESKRMNNVVRFVQLRKNLDEIISHDGSTYEAVQANDDFRDEILELGSDASNERYRARLVRQGDLWSKGVQLGVDVGRSRELGDDDPDSQTGDYYGGKWSVYLDAPDLWFSLVDEAADNLAPLSSFADVHFGVKTGADKFFYPKDASQEALQDYTDSVAFEKEFGVERNRVQSGELRVVKCGEGYDQLRVLDANYLEPEIHSLMDIDTFSVDESDCTRFILLVSKDKEDISSDLVRKYIKWGEEEGYHQRSTCRSRKTANRNWYDLTDNERADIVLPKIQQYRLISFMNPERLYQNSSLLGVYPNDDTDGKALCAAINSTVAILSRLLYARILGNEGNVQLDVYLAKMMLVPNVGNASTEVLDKMKSSFSDMNQRGVLSFLSERRLRRKKYKSEGREDELSELSDQSEMDMADRRKLDHAVLECLGFDSEATRESIIEDLYSYLKKFFERVRSKEEKAQENRRLSSGRQRRSPSEIAAQILESIENDRGYLLKDYDKHFLDRSKPYDTYEVPQEGEPAVRQDLFIDHGVTFSGGGLQDSELIETNNESQAELLSLLADSGRRGLVRVPHDPQECDALKSEYGKFLQLREEEIDALIEERTANEKLQRRVKNVLMGKILSS